MKKEKELKQRVLAYVQEADEELLHLIAEVAETYKKQKKGDWWDKLSEIEKAAIQKGLEDANNDKVLANEDVMRMFKKWH
jgi:predicted transcriptional regulator